jgi:hypothetical protein
VLVHCYEIFHNSAKKSKSSPSGPWYYNLIYDEAKPKNRPKIFQRKIFFFLSLFKFLLSLIFRLVFNLFSCVLDDSNPGSSKPQTHRSLKVRQVSTAERWSSLGWISLLDSMMIRTHELKPCRMFIWSRIKKGESRGTKCYAKTMTRNKRRSNYKMKNPTYDMIALFGCLLWIDEAKTNTKPIYECRCTGRLPIGFFFFQPMLFIMNQWSEN